MSIVRAGKDGKANDIHVFLLGRGGNHFRRLAQAGVDNLHAGVAQRAGNNLCAAIVAVEAGLGDQDANFSLAMLGHGLGKGYCKWAKQDRLLSDGTSSYAPKTVRRASQISPSVA